MFKKLSCLILVLFCFVFSVIPVSATDYGLQTGDYLIDDTDYEVEPLGDVVYPSWASFQSMISALPSDYTVDGYTYNFDAYAVYLAYSATNSDGSFKVEVALWDSSHFDVTGAKYGSGYHNLTATDKLSTSRKGLIRYLWNSTTLEWDYSTYSNASRTGTSKWLYFSEDLLATDGTVYLPSGVYSSYESFLVDDPDYSSGALPDDSITSGGFTKAEKNALFEWLEKIWVAITTGFNSLSGNIGSYFESLGNMIAEKLDNVVSSINSLLGYFEDNGSGGTTGRNLFDAIADIVDSITSGISNITTSIADNIASVVSSITTMADNIVSSISTAADNIVSSITTCIENVVTTLTDFFASFFDNLFDTIENLLTYLFIPSEGYMEAHFDAVNSIYDGSSTYSLKNKYYVLAFIKGFATDFNNFLSQDFSDVEAPTIEVNLGAAESKYNYGTETVSAIDFSWFARYRKYTDPFLSAILWITFIWVCVKRLPDIISGMGMTMDGGIQSINSVYTKHEKMGNDSRKNSYESYKENRERKEKYAAQYKAEKKGGK